MGLGAYKEAWQRQTRDFGHDRADTYSCLILDNRGVGQSSKPLARYSTSAMAQDVLEVLVHVGWCTDPTAPSPSTTPPPARGVNIIGISMGGMIAQELAVLAPNIVRSLLLVSTAPRIVNTVGWLENLRNRVNLFIPRSLEEQIAMTERNMYTSTWLQAPDETEAVVQKFPTNADRFAAGEVSKRTANDGRFTRTGFVCQAIAAGWHCKTAEQLGQLAEKVGGRRIGIVHGTEDKMLTFRHAGMLLEELGGEAGGVSKWWFEGLGHVIPIERRREFFEIVKTMVEKGVEENKAVGLGL